MSNEYKGIHIQAPTGYMLTAIDAYDNIPKIIKCLFIQPIKLPFDCEEVSPGMYKRSYQIKEEEYEKAKNRVIDFERQQREQSFFAISNELPKAVNEIQQARIERLETKLTTLRVIIFIMAVIIISMLVK